MAEEQLFYPCVFRCKTARIDKPVGAAMSREDAERFLKTHYRMVWLNGDAIPQPKDMIDNRKEEIPVHERP